MITNIIWYLAFGIWLFGLYKSIFLISHIAGPLFLGVFSIVNSKGEVNDVNSFYRKMSKIMPALFPPSFLEKTSNKFQNSFTVLIGVLFLLFGVFNLLRYFS